MDSFYIGNLIRCLEGHGVTFDLPRDESGDFLSARWLRDNAGRIEVLHFHWTHHHYTTATWRGSVFQLGKFVTKIVLARVLGYRIVWTMHNYLPHERPYPLLHFIERLVLARLSHVVLVHCEHGRKLLRFRLLRSRHVHVVPLGNFAPYCAPLPDRQCARRQLHVPDGCTVFVYFGLIRPYKQVPCLIREFRALPDASLRLLIVGAVPYPDLEAEILSLVSTDARVAARLEYVSDQVLATYLAAGDVAVFPYRDILGSGSVMLALAAGLPVIAPQRGCLQELVTPECGLLYGPGSGALRRAMCHCVGSDLHAMADAARARASEFPWHGMVQQTRAAYDQALGAV